MKKVLILGAGSAIATETALLFAKNGASLYLIDLNQDRLESVKNHILSYYPNTKIKLDVLNVLDFDRYEAVIKRAIEALGTIDIALIAHGTLPNQLEVQKNVEETIKHLNINFTSVAAFTTILANYFETLGKGSIAVISSVAGDRGRQSNYIYGTAKGGVTRFLQGLRNRLNSKNIQVLTIKPGFVDTPMTAHLPKNPLYVKPNYVAKSIINAIENNKDEIYVPGYWRFIMCIIIHIPEFIFKKMKL